MGKVQIILSKPGEDHVKLKSFQFEIFRFEKTSFYTFRALYYGNILRRLTEIIRFSESKVYATVAEIEKAGFLPEEIQDYVDQTEFFQLKHRQLSKAVQLANLLIVDYCKEFEEEFQRFERSIGYLITKFDHHIGSDQPDVSIFNLTKPDHILFAYAQARQLLRKLYSRTYRDVRRSLRTILRFLLPNMYDEDFVKNVVFSAQRYKTSFVYINPLLWRKKKYSIN